MKKLAIVTGASTGIGRATAQRLVDAGWRVMNLARRACPVAGVESLQVDLAKPLPQDAAATLIAACRDSERTAIVHSAGLLASDSALDVEATSLTLSLQINVVAGAALNRLLIEHLPRGSAIIFVGSTLGDKAVAGTLSYVTSKHAVNGLMRATCQDLAGREVHTAVVSPGFTDTAMLREHVGNDGTILDSLAGNMTFGRLIRPDEIAATIAFCIDNPVINGAVIHANLGQVER